MKSQENPSLQCKICGKWKRLHGKDKDGKSYQRFYPGYTRIDGTEADHGGDVCITCESRLPDWNPYNHPETYQKDATLHS